MALGLAVLKLGRGRSKCVSVCLRKCLPFYQCAYPRGLVPVFDMM